ncbi:10076_t:CDS:2 [Gigaspora margarita]|uniref:(d)CMP kinase n=1 Tax=Gigaspora margarita TaxID=4874 RepID=A0ABN7W6Q2_GIGMA|nr:10076_t:CDS:2 [Gigaspora margarita]
MKKLNIAIDGLTASRKSTIGKILAEKLGYQFIDTGVFYRYLGYNFHQKTSVTKLINTLNNLKNDNKLLQEKAEHTTTEIPHKKAATINEIELKFLEMMLEWRKACVTKSKNIARINVQNVEEFIEENEYSSNVEEEEKDE